MTPNSALDRAAGFSGSRCTFSSQSRKLRDEESTEIAVTPPRGPPVVKREHVDARGVNIGGDGGIGAAFGRRTSE